MNRSVKNVKGGQFSVAAKKEFNIFDHVLVPEHRVLSEEEKEELLRRYRIRISQLPQIKASDPAVVALGAKQVTLSRSKERVPRRAITTTTALLWRTDFGVRRYEQGSYRNRAHSNS